MAELLICGIPSEQPVEMVREAAERLGVSFVSFNQREAAELDCELHLDGSELVGTLRVHRQRYPLAAFAGVYHRLMDPSRLPETRAAAKDPARRPELARVHWLHQLLDEWLELTSIRVMNRARDMASNGSKPYQAQLIAAAGFPVPPTLITNDPRLVEDFRREHGRLIYKSISAVRSIVKVLEPEPDYTNLPLLPTQFQAFIPGTNIRVHVAGPRVYATEIRSEAVDYRYAQRDDLDVDMGPIELPPDIEARCVALSGRLALPLCGIDLKRTPAGQYYCFEVNPSPAFSYYQGMSGQPIADGIVEYLAGRS